MKPVATVHQLARYPVKSMRAEAIPSTTLTLRGVPEDRRYAFVHSASRGDVRWLTARQLPELLRYKPAVKQNGSGEVAVTVTTPGGETWPVGSEELRREIEDRLGRAVFLLHQNGGIYDAAPISVISRQTIAQIAEESGTEQNLWRFRANLVVDLQGAGAFEEMNWIGRVLRVGDRARVAVTEVDYRCVMITLDPENAKPSPGILGCVVQNHGRCAGVYATVVTAGQVRAGDPVWFES
jgi:uncharacterized protein